MRYLREKLRYGFTKWPNIMLTLIAITYANFLIPAASPRFFALKDIEKARHLSLYYIFTGSLHPFLSEPLLCCIQSFKYSHVLYRLVAHSPFSILLRLASGMWLVMGVHTALRTEESLLEKMKNSRREERTCIVSNGSSE